MVVFKEKGYMEQVVEASQALVDLKSQLTAFTCFFICGQRKFMLLVVYRLSLMTYLKRVLSFYLFDLNTIFFLVKNDKICRNDSRCNASHDGNISTLFKIPTQYLVYFYLITHLKG